MMNTSLRASLLCLTLLCSAAAAQAAPAADAGTVDLFAKRPELAEVIVFARWRSLDAAVESARSYVPFGAGARDLLAKLIGEGARAVATAAPVDIVVALDRDGGRDITRPLLGFSLGFDSVEGGRDAVKAAGGLAEPAGKAYAIRLPLPGRQADPEHDLHCRLAAAPGLAKARLGCGWQEHDLAVLGPVLLSVLPALDAGSADLHLDLRVRPAMERYGNVLRGSLGVGLAAIMGQLKRGDERFDRALTDIVNGLSEQTLLTLEDTDRISLDLSLDKSGIAASGGLRFHRQSSYLARLSQDEAAHPISAPELFWRLPANAHSASFSSARALKDIEVARNALIELLDSFLAQEKVSAPERKKITELLAGRIQNRQIVTAWIAANPSAPAGSASKGGPPSQAEILSAFLRKNVIVIASDPIDKADFVKLRELVTLYNTPSMQARMRNWLATAKATPPVIRLLPPPPGLPRDTIDVSVTVRLPAPAKPDADKPVAQGKGSKSHPAATTMPLAIEVIGVLDGDRMFLAIGGDRQSTAAALTAWRSPADPTRTLAQRSGLDALHGAAANLNSGGFYSFAGLLGFFERTLRKDAAGKASLLDSIPHHGETPLVYTTRVTAADPAIDRRLDLRIPRDAIEDLIAFVTQLSTADKK